MKLFRGAAKKGNAEAQMMLSYCLEEGKGIEKDKDESREWLKKAADTGNPFAQAGYGLEIEDEDREEAVKYLKRSSEQDCLIGQLALGMLCMDENEGEKGLELLLKVASLPPSDEKIIMDYMMDEDDRALFDDKEISAINGSIAVAQFAVGAAYAGGVGGIEEDPDEARKWLRKAEASGLVSAGEMLEALEDEEDEAEEEPVRPAARDDGAAELEKGLAAFEDEEFGEAVKLFRTAAKKGNTDAMNMLSYCLEEGIGTDEDDGEAIKWQKKAANAGNALAQAMYGLNILDDEEDRKEEAVRYFKKSAKDGCLLGVFALGGALLMDEETAEEGFEILLRVARMPLTKKTNLLDYMRDDDFYADFDGKNVSATNAIIYMARSLVGMAYVKGIGVEADRDEGIRWYRKAAKDGFKDAKEMLESLEDEADGAAEDESAGPAAKADGAADFRKGLAAFGDEEFEAAVMLFRSAAEKGDVEAQIMLGLCCKKGKGMEEDKTEGQEWFRKAAGSEDPIALAVYGMSLMDEDKEEGIAYLKRSADRGCVIAQFSLGVEYMDDDDGRAVKYFRKAAVQPLSGRKTPLDYFAAVNGGIPHEGLFEEDMCVMDGYIVSAQLMLVAAYLEAHGVEKDLNEAEKWLEKAEKNGISRKTLESLKRAFDAAEEDD